MSFLRRLSAVFILSMLLSLSIAFTVLSAEKSSHEKDTVSNNMQNRSLRTNFELIEILNTQIEVTEIALGDADGDGDLDMAVATSNAPERVYANDGNGQFSLVWQSNVNKDATGVEWADMDGDGDLDLVFNGRIIYIYSNLGVNQFQSTNALTNETGEDDLSIGDIDGNGLLDIFSSAVFLRQSSGEFLERGPASRQSANALGDFNNDGQVDLAYDAGTPVVCLSTYRDNGELCSQRMSIDHDGLGHGIVSMEAGDWDGDGDLDLLIGRNASLSNNNYGNVILENNGGSSMNIQKNNTTLGWYFDTTLDTLDADWSDIDLDGDLDIAVATDRYGSLDIDGKTNHIVRSNLFPYGTYLVRDWSVSNNIKTVDVAWGDVDEDSAVDLIYVNGDGTIQIYQNNVSGTWFTDKSFTGEPLEYYVGSSLALGDQRDRGYPDIAFTRDVEEPYHNHTIISQSPTFGVAGFVLNNSPSTSVAWGDVNNDTDLEIITSQYGEPNILGVDLVGGSYVTRAISPEAFNTTTIVLGDTDGDDDLDLLIGNDLQSNQVMINDGGGFFTEIWESADDTKATTSVAFSDYDLDGDLDFAVGNYNDVNQLFENRGENIFTLIWESADSLTTTAIEWGDINGDGYEDLIVANLDQPNQVYANNLGAGFTLAWESVNSDEQSTDVSVGDVNGDGLIDVLFGSEGNHAYVYRNDSLFQLSLTWLLDDHLSGDWPYNRVAIGDLDRNGTDDLVVGNQIYSNKRNFSLGLASPIPIVYAQYPLVLPITEHAATSRLVSGTPMTLTYTLYDTFTSTVGHVDVYYSLNGGGRWNKAIPTPSTQTQHLNATPDGTNHEFGWDTFANNVFGQSDNVVLRVVAYPQPETSTITGTYRYTGTVAGSIQQAYSSSTTFPFRLRSSQIRVMQDLQPLQHAQIFRLTEDGISIAQPFASSTNEVIPTNAGGYLPSSNTIGVGDELFALAPVTITDKYTVYHSNFSVIEEDISGFVVTSAGVQTLTVSAENPLILLNLTISLEWDARQDSEYLDQLTLDIKRASEILYDLTNGQMALGDVTVYQAGEYWDEADILVLASNNQRPSANLGGIVTEPITDTLVGGTPIPYAFLPGQIRMGATWNRYGNPGGTIGEDWPRALAHEIGHYALFLLDNYLGLDEAGNIIATQCQGSAMTDAYREDYSEFLALPVDGGANSWQGDCLNTIAAKTTGRSDWETILNFYPFLENSVAQTGSGPTRLQLAVTDVAFAPVAAPDDTLGDPFIYLNDSSGANVPLEKGQAQAYLIKTQDTASLVDDVVIPLGAPNGPLVQARGVAMGDRVCVFDQTTLESRIGCLNNTSPISNSLILHSVPAWQPQIAVTPVNSKTLGVTVLQGDVDGNLHVQLLPSYRPTTTVTAPHLVMSETAAGVYEAELSFPMTILHGHARIWEDGGAQREMIAPFFVSIGWNGNAFATWDGNAFATWDGNAFATWDGNAFATWDGNAFATWGGNAFATWGAPVTAPDGQVKLYRPDDILGGNPPVLLQAISNLPNLPGWLTPLGQGYRYQSADPAQDAGLMLQFQYLERELPSIDENSLRIYYLPEGETTWERLPTTIDATFNLASAEIQSAGIYALIATVELPPFAQGWNNFGYPIAETRAVTTALASIDGFYTSVYYNDLFNQRWLLHDATVREQSPSFIPLVNTLTTLEFGRAYWLHVTEAITGYIGVPSDNRTANFELPPATYYGWITPTGSLEIEVGDTLEAWIDGTQCGQTTIQQLETRLAYVLQVKSKSPFGSASHCGEDGATIELKIEGVDVPQTLVWRNSQANFVSIGSTVPTVVTTLSTTQTSTIRPLALLFGAAILMLIVAYRPISGIFVSATRE